MSDGYDPIVDGGAFSEGHAKVGPAAWDMDSGSGGAIDRLASGNGPVGRGGGGASSSYTHSPQAKSASVRVTGGGWGSSAPKVQREDDFAGFVRPGDSLSDEPYYEPDPDDYYGSGYEKTADQDVDDDVYDDVYDDAGWDDDDDYGEVFETGLEDPDELYKDAEVNRWDEPGTLEMPYVPPLPKPEPSLPVASPGSLPKDRPIKVKPVKKLEMSSSTSMDKSLLTSIREQDESRPLGPTDLTWDHDELAYYNQDKNEAQNKTASDSPLSFLSGEAPTVLEIISGCGGAFGKSWLTWDIAVLERSIADQGVELHPQARDILMATRTIINNEAVLYSPKHLEVCATALSGRRVDFSVVQEPDIAELCGVCQVISMIRKSGDDDWSDDIKIYVSAAAIRDGLILLPRTLRWAQAHHTQFLLGRRADARQLQVAMAQSIRTGEPVDIDPRTFARQVALLQRCAIMGGAMLAPGTME